MKHFSHAPRRVSVQAQVVGLALIFTALTSLAVLFSSVLSMYQSSRRGILQSNEYALQVAASSLARDISEIDTLIDWCSVNPTLRTALFSPAPDSLSGAMYQVLANKYASLRVQPYVQRFLVVGSGGQATMFGTAVSLTRALTAENLALLPGMGEGEADTAWQQVIRDPLLTQGQMDSIPVTRTLSSGSRTAHIYVAVSPQLICSALRDLTEDSSDTLYWVMGDMVYRVDAAMLTPVAAASDFSERAARSLDTLDPATQLISLEDGRATAIVYPVGVDGMYLARVCTGLTLNSQLPRMFAPLSIASMAILMMGLAMALLLHRVIARPLNRLQKQIERISNGDFTADPSIEWNNELGDVGRGINSLSRNVTQLMNKRLEDQKQKQELEYRMLQNQINPHFIYNTLNGIKWMATLQHATGIAEMVTALSRLLKSVSKGNERLVPLYEEFALLNDYFTIQQYRYGGTINMDVSYIEDEALAQTCRIPRFTLQPLVENAIFHGIEPKGCAGNIALTVVRAGGAVEIRLADDGVGMTPAQVEAALKEPGPEEAAAKFRHVGMWNVHRRLQYMFGEDYGLSVQSVPGLGTTVTIRLPLPDASAGSRPPLT